jgi:hypothetical protein
MCTDLASHVVLGRREAMLCGDDGVTVVQFPKIPDWIESELCPPGGCWYWRVEPPEEIFTAVAERVRLLARPQVPACDPRCSRVDCCGGPLPREAVNGMFVIWADGADVKRADGVKVLHPGAPAPEPLQAGQRLRYGDLIYVPPQATFDADLAKEKLHFATSPDRKATKARVLLVSGPAAVERQKAPPAVKAPQKEQLEWYRKFGNLQYPGGTPPQEVSPEQRTAGATEEAFEKQMRERLGDQYKPLASPAKVKRKGNATDKPKP